MEAARKRRAGGEKLSEEERAGGGAAAAAAAGGAGTEEEVEVETFFAILRRVREARRCFAVRARRHTWHPKFAPEDFEVAAAAAVRDDGVGAAVAEDGIPRRFDLNAEPPAEGIAESETGR